ncbi:hypothetical protein [Antarcticibacterium sp. 1MA-6-2]|nr:hypothetical protein [Antarcticibacterium sp. 1MA-6-2]
MSTLANLSPIFNIVKEGNQKKDFLNLKVTTRGSWNNRRRFI